MKTQNTATGPQLIARIFEDVGGFFYCDDSLPYLDTRGAPYPSRSAAARAIRQNEADAIEFGSDEPKYTHIVGERSGRKSPV